MSGNLLEQWLSEGYAIVRNMLEQDHVAKLLPISEAILAQWRTCNPETGKPGGGPEATVMRHLNHSGYYQQHPEWFPVLMDAVASDKVLDVARTILQEEPLFRCTSFFFNPLAEGKDGNWHRDSQFVHPKEEEEQEVILKRGLLGKSVQMQIVLVPSDDIEYVPGSHIRWDTPAEYAIRRADGGKHNRSNAMPGAIRAVLAPGDAVLFNPMGLHRGRYHVERLRRTLMLTYTATSAPYYDYFSNQPWFLEPGCLDRLSAKTRAFFAPFITTYHNFWHEKLAEKAKM